MKAPRMTLDQFVEHLRLYGGAWFLDGEGRLRRRRRNPAGQSVRECPLTAVCWEVLGAYYRTGEAYRAGDRLHLLSRMSSQIMCAADHPAWSDCAVSTRRVRRALLRATKVEERPAPEVIR